MMDTSKKNIEMCWKAEEIQFKKFKAGFDEGDYVFCDDVVRIVGHDFISLQKKMEINPWNIFRFAMLESSITNFSTISDEHLPHTIEYKHGEYVIEYLKNPIWIPRQDQLQEMIGQWNFAYSLFDCYRCTPLFYVNKRPHFPFNVFDSLEQCWLAFVMRENYGKHWNGYDWEK